MVGIGIDPGLGGGIAWTLDGVTVDAVNMPDGRAAILGTIKDIAPGEDISHCAIEQLSGGSPMRDGKFLQKRSTMWKLGVNYGHLCMALEALEIPTQYMPPREWQKSFSLIFPTGTTKTVKKNAHKTAAVGLYPGAHATLKTCDAILLTYFGWTWAKRYGKKQEELSRHPDSTSASP